MELSLTKRLENIVKFYDKIEESFDSLPVNLPFELKKIIIDKIVGDDKLRKLIDGIKFRRPPKFILIGKTGVGKSSLINAITGKYLAEESDVFKGTKNSEKFSYKFMDAILFEIIDTCGLNDNLINDPEVSSMLIHSLEEFNPDAVIYLVNGRDYLKSEIDVLKLIKERYSNDIPIIAVLTKSDELQESREKDPNKYSARKKTNIDNSAIFLQSVLYEAGVDVLDIIPVSSYIEWSEDPQSFNKEDYCNLSIAFDGRFNINKLIDVLERNIDLKAGIFLLLNSKIDLALRKIISRFIKIFSGIASGVALTPIPFSDIYVLVALQSVLIMIIAHLSGRDLNYESAKELILTLGAGGVTGYIFKLFFQQGSKLTNVFFPGSGSLLSSTVAGAGTYTIGKSAEAYFLKKKSKTEIRKMQVEFKNQFIEDQVEQE